MSAQGPVIKREKGLNVAFRVCYRNITVDFIWNIQKWWMSQQS